MKYIELAFVVVCVVAILQALGRRLPVPMAVLQIACGVALSSVVALDDLSEQSALLFVMLVPPLLYIEAWQVPKRELLRSIGPVLGLAIGLVTVTIAVVGFGVHALLPEMPLAVAFALAAALASTDTVAVSNFVGRIALPPQLRVLLSGEGLLNDSVALVVFKIAVAAAVTSRFSAGEASLSLLTVSAGGLVTGAAIALVAHALRRALMFGTQDSVRIDTTLSLLIPYAAFLAGDKLGVSGVLAVVAAGLCGGVLDHRHLRATTRLNGLALWSMVTLVLNGAVFVMLGLEMPQVLQRVEGYSRSHLLGYVALLTLAVFAVRMAWTLLLAWWSRRRQSHTGEGLPNFGLVMVAVLCGVRGSLALSATLSIPLFTAAGEDLPGRDLAVFLAAGTIAATLLLSAVATAFLKVSPTVGTKRFLTAQDAHVAIARAALRAFEADPAAAVSRTVREWAMTWKHLYESRVAAMQSPPNESCPHRSDLAAQRLLSMNVLSAQRRRLVRLQKAGVLEHAVMQKIEIELDLAEIALDRLEWRRPEPA
jgi:Na+/H+ antiporter